MILPAWLDHLEESFSFIKKLSPKSFACLWKPVVTLLKMFHETPEHVSFIVWHLPGMVMSDMLSNFK